MNPYSQKIRAFIVTNFLFGKDEDLPEDASFLERGILDSTGVMELVAHLEKEYGIRVDDRELVPENLDSLGAVAAYLERKLALSAS